MDTRVQVSTRLKLLCIRLFQYSLDKKKIKQIELVKVHYIEG